LEGEPEHLYHCDGNYRVHGRDFYTDSVGVELHRHQKDEGKVEKSILGKEQDVARICRAKITACQNNFWNGYSDLPAFDLDGLRNYYIIDISVACIIRHGIIARNN